MELERLLKFAEEYFKRTADGIPAAVRADDLDWINEETRNEIKANGKNDIYLPHNPPGAIASEKIWDRAKKIVKKYWKRYDEPWAVVYDVYRKLGGKAKKKKKKK